jgi:hypothetical protein
MDEMRRQRPFVGHRTKSAGADPINLEASGDTMNNRCGHGFLRGVSTIRLDASNAWESAVLPEISKAYLDGRLMLLLGAGASRNGSDSTGLPLPLSNELAKELASICDLPY